MHGTHAWWVAKYGGLWGGAMVGSKHKGGGACGACGWPAILMYNAYGHPVGRRYTMPEQAGGSMHILGVPRPLNRSAALLVHTC